MLYKHVDFSSFDQTAFVLHMTARSAEGASL